MSTLLSVSIALLAGLLMTRVLKLLKLPDVTSYLLAGVLIGPFFLGRLNDLFGVNGLGFASMESVETLSLISSVALGFIAFSIGNEFRMEELKHIGRQAVVVGIFQAIVATIFVDAALIGLHYAFPDLISKPQAIVLGAIATATAPAATLMVVRQYKAKGPVTDLLLPVVALDDAVGLIIFAVSFGIARALGGTIDLISILVNPLIEIIGSLLLGAVMGWLLTQLEKLFHSNTNRLSMTIAFVFMTVSLSMAKFEIPVGNSTIHIGFSSLLVCMMLGTVFCNTCPLSEDLMEKSDRWTAPLCALFFVISGAELELHVFAKLSIVAIGVIYILFRSAGKIFGSFLSTKWTHCPPTTCKYLGITLLPQAGVALGMCTIAAADLGAEGALIKNITLFAVLVYELIGPMMTKWALTKAGDIQPMSEEVKNRRKTKLENAKK